MTASAATAPEPHVDATLEAAIGALAAGGKTEVAGRALAAADSRFARGLAGIPAAAWSPGGTARGVAAAAAPPLPTARHRKDRPADIPEPPDAGDAPAVVRVVFTREQEIVVAFSFDTAVHQAMLALPERSYHESRSVRGIALVAGTSYKRRLDEMSADSGLSACPCCAGVPRI
jgi:hypothetical protein